MDAIRNPYTPGAGTPPPALAGRDALLEEFDVAVGRLPLGRPAKSVVLVGLRGVGKTVLLDRMRERAEAAGLHCLRIEAPENRSLPALLVPELRKCLLRLSLTERAKEKANEALDGLAGFAMRMQVKFNDLEFSMDRTPTPGVADSGDLEADLQDLFELAGQAAAKNDTAIVLFVDELQYVGKEQLAALIVALHRCAQRRLPVMLVGAGLPQLLGQMGDAKSYAERLFNFPNVAELDEAAAKRALAEPAEEEDVSWDDDAIRAVLERTHRYAYFLQEWGKHAWDIATGERITADDVARATELTITSLDASFFRVRLDRLTPGEKSYLRAMAELGAGPHRSGEIAEILGKDVTALGQVRKKLIAKGMIHSPSHGDTAFTVPLFDEFMCRVMPRP